MPEYPRYDIVVLGAGIQGAGVAQATAAHGYKTLIIEKFPQAGMGTSCKSSKLIHGGLRYLESGQFKLVRECLQERKILLKNASHLVKLIPFYIPVYSHSIRPSWLIWTGLVIYSFFSLKPFSIVKRSQWHTLDHLNLDNLKCIFKYYDAQTDDKKLTQAVIESARHYGAEIIYDAKFKSSHAQKHLHRINYKKSGQLHTIECKCIINCTGPWVSYTQKNISPLLAIPQIELVAGTHIIINSTVEHGVYYIEAEDKRAVFVMPWKNKQTLIGTTERLYNACADDITPTDGEITYLLNTYNRYFNTQVSNDNVVDSFSGLRVLPVSNKSVFNKSRESLIVQNTEQPAIITLIGGKLTSYRASSENVLKEVRKILPEPENTESYNTNDIKL